MKKNFKPAQKKFIQVCEEHFGPGAELTRDQVYEMARTAGIRNPSWMFWKERRVKRGLYTVPVLNPDAIPDPSHDIKDQKTAEASTPALDAEAPVNHAMQLMIPPKNNNYVAWGHHKDIKTAIKSGQFFPIFLSGLSGNGKTLMVHQICAELDRELIRVNITAETDEDDLLGGLRLINGETVFQKGPVIEAMERGAVLLLDEVDLASYKIMCLQPVLEGNPVFLKKLNTLVMPKPGFTIVACANTKGQGDDSGKFMFTNILNEAFLERFSITMEQPYAPTTTEKKILRKALNDKGIDDNHFINHLCAWAEALRKSYEDETISEIIATRRLVHIINAFAMYGDKEKAVKYCIARFDSEIQEAFMSAFKATTPVQEMTSEEVEEEKIKQEAEDLMAKPLEDDDYPF